jgi:hypothetical protein
MPPPLPGSGSFAQGVESLLSPRRDDDKSDEFFSSLESGTIQSRNRSMPSLQTRAAFSDIFDFGFTRFVTPAWVKFVYGVSVLLAIALMILLLVAIVFQATQRPADSWNIIGIGITAYIVLVIILICWLFALRLMLEAILVVFRIEEHGQSIRKMVAGHIARLDAIDKQSQRS